MTNAKRAIVGTYGRLPIDLMLMPGVTRSDLMVYAAIASFAGDKSHCWPSIENIQERCPLNRTTISKTITKLSKSGWIDRKIRGLGMSNIYRPMMPVFDVMGVTDVASTPHPDVASDAMVDVASDTTVDVAPTPHPYKRTIEKNNRKEQVHAFTGKEIRLLTDLCVSLDESLREPGVINWQIQVNHAQLVKQKLDKYVTTEKDLLTVKKYANLILTHDAGRRNGAFWKDSATDLTSVTEKKIPHLVSWAKNNQGAVAAARKRAGAAWAAIEAT